MPNLKKCLFYCVLHAAFCGNGCSQVRLVQDTPDGGVIVIPNNTDEWPSYYRNRAEYLMKRKCPEGYVIISEREDEDNPAARDGRKPNEDFEYEGAYIRITTYNRKAYFIAFRSAAAAPPPYPPKNWGGRRGTIGPSSAHSDEG